jgi:hypothetical protein
MGYVVRDAGAASRLLDAPVRPADLRPRPVHRMLREGKARGKILVDVHTEPRQFVAPHRAVTQLRGPGKHLPGAITEGGIRTADRAAVRIPPG